MIEKAEVQVVPEKVGTHLIGERGDHNHGHPGMKPTRPTMLREHLADLASIIHGAPVSEKAAVGAISANHPLPVHGVTMTEQPEPPKGQSKKERILAVFDDGKPHGAQDVANALQETEHTIGTYLPHLAADGTLVRVKTGVYMRSNGTPPAKAAKARLKPSSHPRPAKVLVKLAYLDELIQTMQRQAAIALRVAAARVEKGDWTEAHSAHDEATQDMEWLRRLLRVKSESNAS